LRPEHYLSFINRPFFRHVTLRHVLQPALDLSAFGIFCLLLLHTALRPWGQDLGLNMRKYSDANLYKNKGLRRQLLKAFQLSSNFLPGFTLIEVDRAPGAVGNGTYDYLGMVDAPERLKRVSVNDSDELMAALSNAQPGTLVLVAPGAYSLPGENSTLSRNGGRPGAPIVVAARQVGAVVINLTSRDGFLIKSPYWHFENFVFRGRSDQSGWNEHAFHLVGEADHVTFVHNEFINFNVAIRANGDAQGTPEEAFPDQVKIVNNNFYNESKRNTRRPVIAIDVVGGNDWQITDNFIADFGNDGQAGFGIAYGVNLNGGGMHATIADNLVVCEWRIPHTSAKDVRTGLSLGGRGTGDYHCPGGKCEYEHLGGEILRNRVLNCVNDFGITLQRAQKTLLQQNQVLGSMGIELRSSDSSATATDNEIEGRLRSRRGTRVDNQP
jgi:hypothetical protein